MQLAKENAALRLVIQKASEYPFIPLNLHNYLINELKKNEKAGKAKTWTEHTGDSVRVR